MPTDDNGSVQDARTPDQVREWIVDELSASLDVDRADIDTAASLQSLGVDSLAAFTLTGELAAWLGRDLPATLVWDYPSIDAMAADLGDGSPAPTLPQGVIAFNEVTEGTPVWCAPGVGGHPVSFSRLAASYASNRPWYGLTTPGFDGKTDPLDSIEAIAASMVERVREVQPAGPYQLIGFSFGGLLAYEMARQLEADGDTPAMLVVLDAYTPNGRVRRPLRERLGVHAYRLIMRPKRLKYLKGRLFGGAEEAPPEPNEEPEAGDRPRQIVSAVRKANRAAAFRYVPGGYGGSMLLVKPAELAWYSAFIKPAADNGWGEVVTGDVDVIQVPGNHNHMLDNQADTIAEAIVQRLVD